MSVSARSDPDAFVSPESFAFPRAGIDAVKRPISEANGLPNAFYTDERLFKAEREHLMARTWACIGFASDLPEGGYARPVSFMGLPLLLVRNGNGGINVFHNVCSHRGMRLVREETAVQHAIRCPYHAWAYDLDGNLKATPHIGGSGKHSIEGFDCCQHGLRTIRTTVWLDMVFINLSGDAPEFSDHMRPLTERCRTFVGDDGFDLLRPAARHGSASLDVGCNWKLAVENYCESYHLPRIHKQLNTYSRLSDHYNILLDGPFAGQGSNAYNFTNRNNVSLPTFPHWPADRLRQAEYVAIYPNVLFGLQADHVFAVLLEPISHDATREHLRIYYIGEQAKQAVPASVHRELLEFWRTVFYEDKSAVEGLQLGRQSPSFSGGVFSPVMDTATYHFHRWVADRVPSA